MGTISLETIKMLYQAYREISAGEKLLQDMAEIRTNERIEDKYAPTIKDAFGLRQQLQLGVPSGHNGHRLLDVSPVLAESCIRAHIEQKRKELSDANERARVEIGMDVSSNSVYSTVIKESQEDERKRFGLGEEEDKGQWAEITKKGRVQRNEPEK